MAYVHKTAQTGYSSASFKLLMHCDGMWLSYSIYGGCEARHEDKVTFVLQCK